jgi:predicted nucleotidyltransferase
MIPWPRSAAQRTGEPRRGRVEQVVTTNGGSRSVARGDERPDSDIDLLVELSPDARPFEILAIGAELEDVLGVKIDGGTAVSLRAHVRDDVLAEACFCMAPRCRPPCGHHRATEAIQDHHGAPSPGCVTTRAAAATVASVRRSSMSTEPILMGRQQLVMRSSRLG